MYTPFTYISSFAIAYNISDDLAFYLISILNAASVFGRIIPGIMADILGVFNVVTGFTIILTIFVAVMWTLSASQGIILAVTVFIGFFSGAFISLFIACVARISSLENFGARLIILKRIILMIDSDLSLRLRPLRA
jgi:predicted MFS family arabinose efflux permease